MKNLSFTYKLLLLIALPVFISTLMLIKQVVNSYSVSEQSRELAIYTELVTANSALVHELQKERGATAGFLGSKGQQFSDVLSQQRRKTQQFQQQWESFVSQNDIENTSLNELERAEKNWNLVFRNRMPGRLKLDRVLNPGPYVSGTKHPSPQGRVYGVSWIKYPVQHPRLIRRSSTIFCISLQTCITLEFHWNC